MARVADVFLKAMAPRWVLQLRKVSFQPVVFFYKSCQYLKYSTFCWLTQALSNPAEIMWMYSLLLFLLFVSFGRWPLAPDGRTDGPRLWPLGTKTRGQPSFYESAEKNIKSPPSLWKDTWSQKDCWMGALWSRDRKTVGHGQKGFFAFLPRWIKRANGKFYSERGPTILSPFSVLSRFLCVWYEGNGLWATIYTNQASPAVKAISSTHFHSRRRRRRGQHVVEEEDGGGEVR